MNHQKLNDEYAQKKIQKMYAMHNKFINEHIMQ